MNRIAIFQQRAIDAAIAAGEPLFMGLPDGWYEPPHWGCDGGHVSNRYLKAEGRHRADDGQHYSGMLCLVCKRPLALIPAGYTDDSLLIALAALDDAPDP